MSLNLNVVPSNRTLIAFSTCGRVAPLVVTQVVLFLDYDGTLSPIVDQPDKAFMNEGMRPVLAQVRVRGEVCDVKRQGGS